MKSIRKTTEQYKAEVFSEVGAEYTVLGEYETNKAKILTRHNKCGFEYEVTPVTFLSRGRRCPKCSGHVKYSLETATALIKEKLGADTIVLDSEYKNNRTPIRIKHGCGHVYAPTISNIRKGDGCPGCSDVYNSKGVQAVTKFFTENGILFKKEAKFKSCKRFSKKSNRYYSLPFDFYIKEHKLLIEYDGEFHVNGWNGHVEQLNRTKNADEFKNDWVRSKKVSLLRLNKTNLKNLSSILNGIFFGERSTTIKRYKLFYIE